MMHGKYSNLGTQPWVPHCPSDVWHHLHLLPLFLRIFSGVVVRSLSDVTVVPHSPTILTDFESHFPHGELGATGTATTKRVGSVHWNEGSR
jgi:hypothetical protein